MVERNKTTTVGRTLRAAGPSVVLVGCLLSLVGCNTGGGMPQQLEPTKPHMDREKETDQAVPKAGPAQIHRAQVGPCQHGGIENCPAHVRRLQAGTPKHRLVHQSELHIRLREAGVLEARRSEICPAQARAGQIGIVEPGLLKHRADQVRAFQMSPGEIGSSEHGAIHLDPPQIEPREVNTRQIGRSEVGTAALTVLVSFDYCH